MDSLLSGGFGLIVMLFLVILAILWFLLPFAIFGTKDKLSELIETTKETNRQLNRLTEEVTRQKKD